MAWEARSGLKRRMNWPSYSVFSGLNGLGSPFGFETQARMLLNRNRLARLNGLGSPFGFETERLRVLEAIRRYG